MARMQEARESSTARRTPRSAAAKSGSAAGENTRFLQEYQNALQFMQQGKFEKARVIFEKLAREAPPEIIERSRVYLAVCARNAADSSLTFKTPEEQYDYAVSLLNTGSYEEARDQFEAILFIVPAGRLRPLRHGPAQQHDRPGRRSPRAPQPRHRAQSLQSHSGP